MKISQSDFWLAAEVKIFFLLLLLIAASNNLAWGQDGTGLMNIRETARSENIIKYNDLALLSAGNSDSLSVNSILIWGGRKE